MLKENKVNFSTKAANIYLKNQCRILEQRTTNATPFVAYFGRSPKMTLKNIFNLASNLKITEKKRTTIETTMGAGHRYRDSEDKKPLFLIHSKLTKPLPQSEFYLKLKLARHVPQ